MTRLGNTAETGYANGTDVTTTNSDDGGAGNAFAQVAAGATGSSKTYSTTNPKAGSLCWRLVIPAASGNVYLRAPNTITGETMAARFYFLIESYAGTGTNAICRLTNASGARMAQAQLDASGTATLTNATGTPQVTSADPLALDTWYRFEVWITPGTTTTTGRISMGIFEGDSEAPLLEWASLAMNAGTALTPRTVELGRAIAAAGAYTMRFDELVVDDGIGETYIGPLPNPALDGVVAAVSDASGVLGARRPLAGVAAAGSGASGVLSARRPLAGQAPSTSSATGAIDVANPALDGVAAAVSGASGTISARRPLAGTVSAIATASGTIGARRPLAGTAVATADTLATLGARRPLVGVAAAVSAASGTMRTLGAGARVYYGGDRVARAYHLGGQVIVS